MGSVLTSPSRGRGKPPAGGGIRATSLPVPLLDSFFEGETLCLNEAGILVHKASKEGLKSAYFRKPSFWLNVKPT